MLRRLLKNLDDMLSSSVIEHDTVEHILDFLTPEQRARVSSVSRETHGHVSPHLQRIAQACHWLDMANKKLLFFKLQHGKSWRFTMSHFDGFVFLNQTGEFEITLFNQFQSPHENDEEYYTMINRETGIRDTYELQKAFFLIKWNADKIHDDYHQIVLSPDDRVPCCVFKQYEPKEFKATTDAQIGALRETIAARGDLSATTRSLYRFLASPNCIRNLKIKNYRSMLDSWDNFGFTFSTDAGRNVNGVARTDGSVFLEVALRERGEGPRTEYIHGFKNIPTLASVQELVNAVFAPDWTDETVFEAVYDVNTRNINRMGQ
jgi:hypothetical protein